ncbi:MAG: protease HtpX [Proteobacteria bacterium]|nr:protease HtpX [Pseudomonadota bacterium]
MTRILLFLGTNIAILVVAFTVMSLLGVEGVLAANGVDLNLGSLMVISLVWGMAGSFVSLALSKFIAKRMMGARVIDSPRGDEENWLLQRVGQHAQAAGIGMPEVAVYDSPEPNAFATGARRNNALVAVSTGLLRSMDRDEVDAVLAHEVSHVGNGDMVTLALIQGVVNAFVIFLSRVFGHFVDRVVLRNERGYGMGYFVAVIVSQIVFGILASTVVMAFSRRREYRADAGAARLVGAGKMISALRSLERGVAAADPLPEQISAFGINNSTPSRLGRLFATHPTIEQRVAALSALGS